MARDLLMPSLRPLLMLMLLLTLGWPTDTPATATDSTGHTDTVHTTVDILDIMAMDTEPTDIPTTDKDIAARFFLNICLDTTQMCSESQSRNVESHLSKSSETKKKSENKTSAWAVLKKILPKCVQRA